MSTELEIIDLTQIVGDVEIPCDWNEQAIHQGNEGARWVASLAKCVCGRAGVRLICTHCKDMAVQTEDVAICGGCGAVFAPFRQVLVRLEPLK